MRKIRYWWVLVTLLVFSIVAPATSFAREADDDECYVSSYSKYRKPFSFDELRFEPLLTQADLEGRLNGLYSREGSIEGAWFGFPLLSLLPTRALGICDWWPEQLAWVWRGENRVFFNEGEDESVRASIWSLGFDIRWYFRPELFAGCGYQHHSFGGLESSETRKFVENRKIDVSEISARDFVFCRFAHQWQIAPKFTFEYRLDAILWEAKFYDVFSSFFNRDVRKSYRSLFGAPRFVYRVNPVSDLSASGHIESRKGNKSYVFGVAYDMFLSKKRLSGLSLFYEDYNGPDSTMRVGLAGQEMNRKLFGIRFFLKSS